MDLPVVLALVSAGGIIGMIRKTGRIGRPIPRRESSRRIHRNRPIHQ
jgi:hypothetical protein